MSLFSYFKKDKDKESMGSNEQERCDFNALNDKALDKAFMRYLEDMNIEGEKAESFFKSCDRKKKILLCQQQSGRSEWKTEKLSPNYFCTEIRSALDSKNEAQEKLLHCLRISLETATILWMNEFKRGGFQLIVLLVDRLIQKSACHKKAESAVFVTSNEDEALAACIHHTMKCVRAIVNTLPGVKFFLQPESLLCSKLVDALYILVSKNFNSQYDQPIITILGLLAATSFLGRDQQNEYKLSGSALFMKELLCAAERRNVGRFRCIIDCFRQKSVEIMYKALVVINTLLSSVEEEHWQIRIMWRNEFMAAGFKAAIPLVKKASETNDNIHRAFSAFEEEKEADYKELLASFGKLKGDIDDPKDCFNMLVASSKNTDCEELLSDILIKLLLINNRKYSRFTYYYMVRMCLTEIAFGDLGCGPEFSQQIVFSKPIGEILQGIENYVSAKPNNVCESVAASLSSSAKIGSVPQAPPLPTLPVNSKDAPPAPPPPPISLLGKSKSGPPAPPPPPPSLLGNTKAPPPPPASLLNSKIESIKPIAPPAPPFQVPGSEIPDFLKKRSKRLAEVPMKKIQWNSEIIKPNQIKPESLWAEIDESVITEDIFDTLKRNFATSSKSSLSCTASSSLHNVNVKTKVPFVIQDGKLLQSLEILHGSSKLSLKEWKRVLLAIDEDVLQVNTIERLSQMLPPPGALVQLKELAEKEFNNMVDGERFIATLAQINFLNLRLEAIVLKLSWKENASELQGNISTLARACEEVRLSKGLAYFVSIVLSAGNFMARTSASKDSFAFELGALNKLVNTKDRDNVETLLHCLIRYFDKKWKGRFTNFMTEDFLYLLPATRIDLPEVSKTKISMKNSLEKISSHLRNYTKQSNGDFLVDKLSPFLSQAQKDISDIEESWNSMQTRWQGIQKYLCFDAKKYGMDKLFGDLHLFKSHYENALRDVRRTKDKQVERKQTQGVIDEIEEMLSQGKYRPGSTKIYL